MLEAEGHAAITESPAGKMEEPQTRRAALLSCPLVDQCFAASKLCLASFRFQEREAFAAERFSALSNTKERGLAAEGGMGDSASRLWARVMWQAQEARRNAGAANWRKGVLASDQ